MFQRFITDAPRGMAQPQNFSQASAVPVPQTSTPEIRPVPKRPGPKHRGAAPSRTRHICRSMWCETYLTQHPFLLQHYGSFCFNTQITIPIASSNSTTKKEESQFLSDFYRELLYYFRRSFACEFHRLQCWNITTNWGSVPASSFMFQTNRKSRALKEMALRLASRSAHQSTW